jgi:hypothetical protein
LSSGFVFTPQESLDFFFFLPVGWTYGNHSFHPVQLFSGHGREMADEVNEFPAILVVTFDGLVAEPGHPREPNAIVDDVEELTIAEVLGLRLSHIGRFRIQPPSNGRVAASIHSMAKGAVVCEMLHGFGHHGSIDTNRVRGIPSAPRNSQAAQATSDSGFNRAWFTSRTNPA